MSILSLDPYKIVEKFSCTLEFLYRAPVVFDSAKTDYFFADSYLSPMPSQSKEDMVRLIDL